MKVAEHFASNNQWAVRSGTSLFHGHKIYIIVIRVKDAKRLLPKIDGLKSEASIMDVAPTVKLSRLMHFEMHASYKHNTRFYVSKTKFAPKAKYGEQWLKQYGGGGRDRQKSRKTVAIPTLTYQKVGQKVHVAKDLFLISRKTVVRREKLSFLSW